MQYGTNTHTICNLILQETKHVHQWEIHTCWRRWNYAENDNEMICGIPYSFSKSITWAWKETKTRRPCFWALPNCWNFYCSGSQRNRARKLKKWFVTRVNFSAHSEMLTLRQMSNACTCRILPLMSFNSASSRGRWNTFCNYYGACNEVQEPREQSSWLMRIKIR